MRITEVIDALEHALRQGHTADEPEGARYVVISETALNRIIQELQHALPERPDAEYFDADAK